MAITLVACLEINGGIGKDNDLLFEYPKDLKHFKSITSGKIVVMGRKTWESLPKKPLEKRKNYILTSDESFNPSGAKVIHSIEDVIRLGKTHDVYIIGGGTLYEQMFPYADRMILTHVHDYVPSDTEFPEIDSREWTIEKMTKNEPDEQHPKSFTFATYKRKATKEEVLDKAWREFLKKREEKAKQQRENSQ